MFTAQNEHMPYIRERESDRQTDRDRETVRETETERVHQLNTDKRHD